MRMLLFGLLALSATLSAACIYGVFDACLHKNTLSGKDGTAYFRAVDVFQRELAGRTRNALILKTAGLLIFAAGNFAGAVFYGVFFFSERLLLIPAGFLLFSCVLVFLLSRYYRYLQFLILCCAARACERRRKELNVANTKDLQ